MSRKLRTGAAINEAIAIAMRTDPTVILMGEDVAGGGARDKDGTEEVGGVLGTTKGLVGEFAAGGFVLAFEVLAGDAEIRATVSGPA